MSKIKKRAFLMLIMACVLCATAIFLLPIATADADTSDTVAAWKSRNENLVVKYSLDDKTDNKLVAEKWDAVSRKFVTDTALAATVVNEDGAVTVVDGVEGSGALSFTAYAHTEAPISLPNATGMTVSFWAKNVDSYWGALVEFWDGQGHGGRFGKGPIQGNGGTMHGWAANGELGAFHNGGANSSFITDDGDDKMNANQWYQVTFTLSGSGGSAADYVMKAYRNGVLKREYYKVDNNEDCSNITKSIMDAVRNGNCKVGLHLYGNGNANDKNKNADYMDDFRIYNGAMSGEEVAELYNEYAGIKALGNRSVKLDGDDTEYVINNGNNVKFTSTADEFPKILIGGIEASAVTENGGVYSASGSDFGYTYTVGEYAGNERVAIVTYTAGGDNHIFTVTQVNPDIVTVRLTSLQIKTNDGAAVAIDGFSSEKTDYRIYLTPDVYKVEFVGSVDNGGTTNIATVNENINYNGENVITTIRGSKVSVSYTVTLSRDRSDTAAPSLHGTRIGVNTNLVYVNELPVSASDIALAYPNGSLVQDFTYNATLQTVEFGVVDKLFGNKTEYGFSVKLKQEGHVGYWSFDSGLDGNKQFAGKRYDSAQGKMVEDPGMIMTVYPGSNNAATTTTKTPKAATVVSGMIGSGADLGSYGYAVANIAPISGATGFTFSTWMKLEGGNAWEAVVAVSDARGTKGTILEKGHMQSHAFENGQPINGWGHLNDATGTWVDSGLDNADKRGEYFNTPASGQSYVFYTVTAEYVNGTGTIKFYKNGVLAATHDNNEKTQVIIEALNEGASIGLHRHHYDSGNSARYDETHVYSYAMTAEEISAQYEAQTAFGKVEVSNVSVGGLGYPDILIGGATSVTDNGGVKTGITSGGITYTYIQPGVAPTKAADDAGVTVTLNRGGATHEITVCYERTLPEITATKLGYTIDGEAKQITVASGLMSVTADISTASVNKISEGVTEFNKYDGDTDGEHYNIVFNYDASAQKATVTLSYRDYTQFSTVYTINFNVLRDGTAIHSLTVTDGKREVTLTSEDFTDGVALLEIDDPDNFTVTIKNAVLDEGAILVGATGGELSFTASDLVDGKFTFIVRSELNTESTYSIQPKTLSDNAGLSALGFGEFTLSPEFATAVLRYTITVDKGEGNAVYRAMTYTAADGGATVEKHYNLTDGVITLTVTAENKRDIKVYVITVAEVDTDATLSEITVGGEVISGFGADKTEYTYKYSGEVPEVAATANSVAASVAVSEYADGKITVTVTAESGATKTYTVLFILKSSDTAIVKLTVNGITVALDGDAGSVELPDGTNPNNITVIAKTAEGARATYAIEEDNVKITVTAEDGTEKVYTVAVSYSDRVIPSQPAASGTVTDETVAQGGCGSSISATSFYAAIALIIAAACIGLFNRKRKNQK